MWVSVDAECRDVQCDLDRHEHVGAWRGSQSALTLRVQLHSQSVLLVMFVVDYTVAFSPPSTSEPAPCGHQGCKNRPAPFPGRMSYQATKPGLVSVLYLSML